MVRKGLKLHTPHVQAASQQRTNPTHTCDVQVLPGFEVSSPNQCARRHDSIIADPALPQLALQGEAGSLRQDAKIVSVQQDSDSCECVQHLRKRSRRVTFGRHQPQASSRRHGAVLGQYACRTGRRIASLSAPLSAGCDLARHGQHTQPPYPHLELPELSWVQLLCALGAACQHE